MKRGVLILSLVAVVGCSASPNPDPDAYLDELRNSTPIEGMGYGAFSDEELLALGNEACSEIEEAFVGRPDSDRIEIINSVATGGRDRLGGLFGYNDIVWTAARLLCPDKSRWP